MNKLNLLKKMVGQGLAIEKLPENLKEVTYELIDLSDNFKESDEELEALADGLLSDENLVHFYAALPDDSVLKEKHQLQHEKALTRELLKWENTMERKIANAKAEELETILQETENFDWEKFQSVEDGIHEKLLQQIESRKNDLQDEKPEEKNDEEKRVKEEKVAPEIEVKQAKSEETASVPNEKIPQKPGQKPKTKNRSFTEKDLEKLGVPKTNGTYPDTFEHGGKRYFRKSFLGVKMLKEWHTR